MRTRNMLMLAVIAAAVYSGRARAAVAEGENLLINGTFEAEQVEFPEFWTPSNMKQVRFLRTGGPEGKMAAVVLDAGTEGSDSLSVRQQGLCLVPGGTYRLSANIRTKGFKSRHAGLVIHNRGWFRDNGIKALPADSEWTRHQVEFTLFPSENNEYGVACFAQSPTGELAIADVRLEALSAEARAGSKSQMAWVNEPRLVPIEPLLNQIPLQRPELTLAFYGVLPESTEAYEWGMEIKGRPIPVQRLAATAKRLSVPLKGLACGDYQLRALLRRKQGGETVMERVFPISVVDQPELDLSGIKPLNTLVAELLERPLAPEAAPQHFSFVRPRDGWIFVSVSGCAEQSAAEVTATLDGAALPLWPHQGCREAFRLVTRGAHQLTVSGVRPGMRLRVNAIPEIFNYPPCVNPVVPENGAYDWAFMKRHVLHAVTTLNGGNLPGEALSEAKARGLLWLANFNVAPVDDPVALRERMAAHAGMTQPRYDGITSDELFFGRITIDHYTQALWSLPNPENRRVYTWIVGKPGISSLHTDFMSACLNASHGRGRLLYEAYCHPQEDERAAAAYLDNMIAETMRRFNVYLPNAAAGSGIIFGNFNQLPVLSLEHNPAVDFKVFLDMQVNLVANDPVFEGLATIGYWGTYYGDEEMARWSFELMRHYAVEGRRDRLSERYGFRYRPELVVNGDFTDGLTGWEVAPAAEGAVRAETLAGYGKNSQGRWGAGKAGDTFCLLTRQPNGTNRVSQTARGLTPGKLYCLQFVTADHTDVVKKHFNPRRYGIEVEMPGVERDAARSFVHIDRRKGGRYEHNDNVAKVNLHRIVFRATAPTLTLVFHDASATPGETLMLNFVQMKPYRE